MLFRSCRYPHPSLENLGRSYAIFLVEVQMPMQENIGSLINCWAVRKTSGPVSPQKWVLKFVESVRRGSSSHGGIVLMNDR